MMDSGLRYRRMVGGDRRPLVLDASLPRLRRQASLCLISPSALRFGSDRFTDRAKLPQFQSLVELFDHLNRTRNQRLVANLHKSIPGQVCST